MITIRKSALVFLFVCALPTNILADNNFGVGVKAGSLGLGLEGIWRPIPMFDFRLGGNKYDHDDTKSRAGIAYDGSLNLETFYATVNFHIPLMPLHFSVGAYSNGNELNLTSEDAPDFDIGGITYSAEEVGVLSSKTKWGGMAPYVGAGFDFDLFNKVGVSLDFGVLLHGEPKVTLISTGSLSDNALFLTALEIEREELEDKVDKLKVYPVVSLGFKFNF